MAEQKKTKVLVFATDNGKNKAELFRDFYPNYREFDVLYLNSTGKEKILKKDIDLDFSLLDKYDLIFPVGAEALKYICKLTGVVKYNGTLIEKKWFPLIHTNMLFVKPQYRDDLVKAFKNLEKIEKGEVDTTIVPKNYQYIDTCAQFTEYLKKLYDASVIVVDIETTSLSARTGFIIGVAFSTAPHEGVFVTNDVIHQFKQELRELFRTKKCLFHNAKFDMAYLQFHYGWTFPDFEDTMLLHYCLDESVGSHGLKGLAMKFTDLGDYEAELEAFKKEYCRKNKIKVADFNYGMIPTDILSLYACKDGDATIQLFYKFYPLVSKNEKFSNVYENILKPASRVLRIMENNGGPVSITRLLDLIGDLDIDIEECLEEIARHPDVRRFERVYEKTFNANSVMQLRTLFFTIQNEDPIKYTDSDLESTDKEVLGELAANGNTLAEAILDLRTKSKMRNTYLQSILEGLDTDQRLRSNFNIHGTTSGRLSSSGVLNYQNLPRDNTVKKVFAARPGYVIVECDLATAEVYYAAVLSNDKFLQKAFIDGVDFHSYVAKQMFSLPCEIHEVKKLYPIQRQAAKAITFGILYSAGPAKIMEQTNKEIKDPKDHITLADAKLFISKYFREASALRRWIDQANLFIQNNAYIYSHFGRKRRLPESTSENRAIATHAVRSGVNFLIQSVASDVNILGLIDLTNWIEESGYENDILPFTVVHDSIVSEVREDLVEEYIANARRCIQTDRGVGIPGKDIGVDFKVGPSWGEVKEIK